jgi:hypothetical protein
MEGVFEQDTTKHRDMTWASTDENVFLVGWKRILLTRTGPIAILLVEINPIDISLKKTVFVQKQPLDLLIFWKIAKRLWLRCQYWNSLCVWLCYVHIRLHRTRVSKMKCSCVWQCQGWGWTTISTSPVMLILTYAGRPHHSLDNRTRCVSRLTLNHAIRTQWSTSYPRLCNISKSGNCNRGQWALKIQAHSGQWDRGKNFIGWCDVNMSTSNQPNFACVCHMSNYTPGISQQKKLYAW